MTRRLTADLIHRGTERLRVAGAIGPDSAWGRQFRSFGAFSCISYPPATIFGEAAIEIGSGTMIGPNATISAGFGPGQDLGDRSIVRIGDRVLLGRGSHVIGHAGIDIGDDVYTGPYVYITDQNHTYADPQTPIGRQWPTNSPVRIGSGSWLGTGAIVLPGADIGRNVVIAAGAVVRGTVPDCCVVAGIPAKVVRTWTQYEGWQPPIEGLASIDDIDPAEQERLAELFGLT